MAVEIIGIGGEIHRGSAGMGKGQQALRHAILRAVYLTRRYGRVDRADVPFALAQLALQVDDSLRLGADEHARTLIRPA